MVYAKTCCHVKWNIIKSFYIFANFYISVLKDKCGFVIINKILLGFAI